MWWDQNLRRIALLELVITGSLNKRKRQSEAWDELIKLRWVRHTSRQDKLALAPEHRGKVEDLLGKVWPGWRCVAAALAANALQPIPSDLDELEDLQRQATIAVPLPPRLNQRTAIAAVGPHSKAVLSEQRLVALGSVDLTRDGIVRVRPHRGLQLRRAGTQLNLAEISAFLGEVTLPERALNAGLELAGPEPALVLLVENLGTYIDIPAPPDWLIVHVPGWNTVSPQLLLPRLPDVPVLLFGDLDPAGVEIAAHLQSVHPPLRWVTFDLWRTLLPAYAQIGTWPEDQDLRRAPPLVHELVRAHTWLEQERLVLNERLIGELLAVAHAATT